MKTAKTIVILDVPFSNVDRNGKMLASARGVAIKANVEKPKGSTIIMSATSDEQTAFAYKEQKHGLFTYFLLKYFQDTKGKGTLGGLADYITTNVGQQSMLINGKKQTPTIIIPDGMEGWRNRKITDLK